MTQTTIPLHRWPALAPHDVTGSTQISYERGIWGKVHGAPSDFRWIATTPAFSGPANQIELQLALGPEDALTTFGMWLTHGSTCYAVACYPSAARDASGRSGFLEKQILEWERPAEMPAVLGALLLLPAVAALDSSVYWDQCADARWMEDDHLLNLDAAAHPALSTSLLRDAIDDGLRTLKRAATEETLASFYGAVLAGNHAVSLQGIASPLPPTALAALLLPFPRSIADSISIAGWLPATRLPENAADSMLNRWTIIVGGAVSPPAAQATPDAEQLRMGKLMAGAIMSGDPSLLARLEDTDVSPSPVSRSIQLTLWGPSAAGKTVLLANLYLETDDADWDVFPTERALQFIEGMRNVMRTSNQFPSATPIALTEKIEYLFRHKRSGLSALLALEDRAGLESEKVSDERNVNGPSLKERLATADGLVLLFDPISDPATLEARVWRTLEIIHVGTRRGVQKDARPIAVCVSKADVLIRNAADYRSALEDPDRFVRDRVPAVMLRALDRFCSDYRLFPVSAAGVRLRYGVIEPAVFYDENLAPRICPGGRAFNLMTPFSWLLNRLTEAPV
ncbi:MAG TPA: hypothetical protein VHW00_20005 [Thermoanaerobaculia bacterium]|nr:hypothetical protein [Thermoanaerobaculia bacterium]